MERVIISLPLRNAPGRDVLSGVFRHLDRAEAWALHLMQPDVDPLTPENIRAAEKDGVAGLFVTKPGSPELMRALNETSLPVAAIGFCDPRLMSRKGPTTFVLNDNAGIGAMGANYFLKLGKFNSFGFVLAGNGTQWMDERETGFRERIAAVLPKATVKTFCPAKTAICWADEDIAALAEWIAALPKPAAVMSVTDFCAIRVLKACELAHVHLPDSVALLGVDNDEFLCVHASTPISSVLPGHAEMGLRAAEEMSRLIAGKVGKRHRIVSIPPMRVVERESTRIRTPSAVLVDRAKRFIAANAAQGISAMDVVRHLKVSQRLAEMRYRAATGKTIRESIESARMDKLKMQLASTRRPIAVLAAECGFRNSNSLSHRFRKLFGSSMRDYRAQNHATAIPRSISSHA